MISVGAKVRFCPACDIGMNDTPEERAEKKITGTVFYVNRDHSVFWAEYAAGNTRQVESFKFVDIGKAVKIIG